jgi:uncharacterized protein (TIGR02996 family)
MPTADDFLRAIIADPDADALRLAYADWLEEGGDADRAEFIRVQCALAAMPENERKYHPLRGREVQLLKQHRDAWLRPLRDLLTPADAPPPGWLGWFQRAQPHPVLDAEFRRGFVEYLVLDPVAFLGGVETLLRLTPLRSLVLDVRESPDVNGTFRAVMDCPHLAGLRSLSLKSHRLGADEMRRLTDCPHLPNLRTLSLGCDGIDRSAAQTLVASGLLPRLKNFQIVTFGADNAPWADVILEAPAVRGLTALTVVAMGGVADLFQRLDQTLPFRSLTELLLRRLWTGDHGLGPFLDWLPPTLTHLDLWRTGLGDRTAASLAGWPCLRRLRRLRLCENEINDHGALTLADSPNLVATTQLDLTGNPISDRVKEALRIRLQHQITI